MKSRSPLVQFLFYMVLIVPVGLMASSQTLSKLGTNQLYGTGEVWNWLLVGAYVLFLLRGLVWLFVIKHFPLLFAYPIGSLSYIIVLLIAAGLFDETVTTSNVTGSVFIMVGVTILAIGEQKNKRTENV